MKKKYSINQQHHFEIASKLLKNNTVTQMMMDVSEFESITNFDDFFKSLEENSSLQELNLTVYVEIKNKKLLKSLFTSINQIPTLRKFESYFVDRPKEDLLYLCEFLQEAKFLKVLDLTVYNTNVGLILDAVKSNQNIKDITLRYSSEDLEESSKIFDLKHINSLKLPGNNLNEYTLKTISDHLKVNTNITSLSFEGERLYDYEGIYTSLTDNQHLVELNLEQCRIQEIGFKTLLLSLTKNKTLKTLHISLAFKYQKQSKEYLYEMLKHNSTIENIYITDFEISQDFSKEFSKGMIENKGVKLLIFKYTNISECQGLFESILIENKNINYLELKQCEVGEIWKDLSKGIELNQSMKVFKILDCNIGAQGMKDIYEALEKNTSITNLCIHSEEYLESLANHVKSNNSLETLELKSMRITESNPLKTLLKSVESNKNLKTFNFIYSSLGDNEGLEVAKCIKENLYLKRIDLSFNNFDKTLKDLFESLQFNQNLEYLNLAYNGELFAEEEFAEWMQFNYSLLEFETSKLDLNNLIAPILKRNKNLSKLYKFHHIEQEYNCFFKFE